MVSQLPLKLIVVVLLSVALGLLLPQDVLAAEAPQTLTALTLEGEDGGRHGVQHRHQRYQREQAHVGERRGAAHTLVVLEALDDVQQPRPELRQVKRHGAEYGMIFSAWKRAAFGILRAVRGVE